MQVFQKMLYLCGVLLHNRGTDIAGNRRHWKSIGYLKPPKQVAPQTDRQCPCI